MYAPGVRVVPATVPSAASAKPAGSAPESSDHVYVSLPPLAASFAENGTPTSHGVGCGLVASGFGATIASGFRTVIV